MFLAGMLAFFMVSGKMVKSSSAEKAQPSQPPQETGTCSFWGRRELKGGSWLALVALVFLVLKRVGLRRAGQ